MGFHLGAFTATVGAAASYADLNLSNDQHWTPGASGKAIMPYRCKIRAAYVQGATLSAARLYAPSLRDIVYPELNPITVGTAPGDLPSIVLPDQGFEPVLQQGEEANIQASNTGAGEVQTGFLWAQSSYDPAPPGIVHTLKLTSAVTGSANQWDSGVMTPSDTLPPSRYAVVGMHAWGANIIAARLIPTQGGPRPGVLALASVGLDSWPWFRYGRFGKFLEFTNTSLPNIEYFKTAAGTTQTVLLDIVRIA